MARSPLSRFTISKAPGPGSITSAVLLVALIFWIFSSLKILKLKIDALLKLRLHRLENQQGSMD